MPSEQRLHPASILFALARIVRMFAVPGLLLLFGIGRSPAGEGGRPGRLGPGWEIWMMVLIVPSVLAAVARFLSFRLSYEGTELVIRSGIVFRNERHVPYSRIQNLDARQNIVHRALGVTEVRVETGAGREPEATISVLPVRAFEEMRRRVFEGRAASAGAAVPVSAVDAPPAAEPEETARTVLALPVRELLLLGFLENRGLVVIGALYGLLWELGLFERITGSLFADDAYGPGMIRDAARQLAEGKGLSAEQILIGLAGIAGLLVVVRLVSMAWAVVRLFGFRLVLTDGDLRTEFGSFTRVSATIPLRRVQTLTIHQGPLQRRLARASAKVETAGGAGGGRAGGTSGREWLAPIIRASSLPDLAGLLLPGVDLAAIAWQPVHPRAFRRAVKPNAVLAIAGPVFAAWVLGAWALWLIPLTMPLAVVAARGYVDRMGWAATDEVVLFRSGWLWRRITAAPVSKIQVVTSVESPFDRRTAMARVRIDTAGAGDRSHRVDIPYLPRDTASRLHARLAALAAGSEFRW